MAQSRLKPGEMFALLGPEMPDHVISTQYGKITWSEYLSKEKERIGNQEGRIVEIKNNCLFVNNIVPSTR